MLVSLGAFLIQIILQGVSEIVVMIKELEYRVGITSLAKIFETHNFITRQADPEGK